MVHIDTEVIVQGIGNNEELCEKHTMHLLLVWGVSPGAWVANLHCRTTGPAENSNLKGHGYAMLLLQHLMQLRVRQ